MKAKDTAMSEEEIWDIIKKYNPWGIEQRLVVAEHQAEISFKAGIKEVVDWLRTNLPDEYGSIVGWSVWQAKLKDWGIGDIKGS